MEKGNSTYSQSEQERIFANLDNVFGDDNAKKSAFFEKIEMVFDDEESKKKVKNLKTDWEEFLEMLDKVFSDDEVGKEDVASDR